MADNVQALTSQATWVDAAIHLKDFASKYPVPNVVKVSKGQYKNIGVAKSVHNELYLHSIRTCRKVLAEGVKVKDSKKSSKKSIVTSDQKFALPVSYQGWFELLSEDGKAIRPIGSVQELARVFPQKVLIRENIKGYVNKDNIEMTMLDKSRVILAGEQLTLVGDFNIPQATSKGIMSRRLLRCMDLKGESVYLSYDQKGMFSPIAGQGNISGVHNIKGILEKFRLPILVRLVHGIIPMKLEKNAFTGVFRLLGVYSDETAFVFPLKKDAKMVPISTREPIKLIPAQNFKELEKIEECVFYHNHSTRMISSYLNSIHVLVNPPDLNSIKKAAPIDDAIKTPPKEAQNPAKHIPSQKTEEDILFEEIDDIYQYVRDGGKPPPPRPRPGGASANVMPKQSSFEKKFGRRSSPPNQAGYKSPSSPGVPSHSSGSPHGYGPSSPVWKGNSPNLKMPNPKHRASPDRPSSPLSSQEYHGSQPVLPPSKEQSSLALDQRHDDHYWEEPIYDEIDKFQKKLKAEAEARSKQSPQELNLTSMSMADLEPQLKGDSGSPKQLSRFSLPSEPIENLRQTYRRAATSSDDSGSRPNSEEDVSHWRDSTDVNLSTPPVPPKRFDVEDVNRVLNGGTHSESNSENSMKAEPHISTQTPKKLPDPPLPPKKSDLTPKKLPDQPIPKKGIDSPAPSSPVSKEIVNLSNVGGPTQVRRHSHVTVPVVEPPSPRRHSMATTASQYSGSAGPHISTNHVMHQGPTIASVRTNDTRPGSRHPGGASIRVQAGNRSPTQVTGATHMIYGQNPSPAAPGTHTHRISLTSQSVTPRSGRPQYVAVARVGDESSDSAYGTSESGKKHIQTMYL